MNGRLESTKEQLDNLFKQQQDTKAEVGKPFPNETEFQIKSARLIELDTLLNIDGKNKNIENNQQSLEDNARQSVLESLKRPIPPRITENKVKQYEEVR